MTRVLCALMIAGLAACGDSTPPAKPAAPAPQAAAPVPIAPAPAPETKAPEAFKSDPDKELAQRVKRALEADGKVQVAEIDVTAKDGRVSLWGTAATTGERNRAGQIASKVQGVASVDNQIKIVKGS